MLTAEELAAIKEREAKATKGPWSCSTEENGNTVTIRAADGTPHTLGTEITEKCCDGEPSEEEAANGYFIAHARTDIPRLVAAYKDAVAAADALNSDVTFFASLLERTLGFMEGVARVCDVEGANTKEALMAEVHRARAALTVPQEKQQENT